MKAVTWVALASIRNYISVMLIYYAHCIAIYNTAQERRDLAALTMFGNVINPNSKECSDRYKAQGMAYFQQFSATCDAVAFRALPDGSIPSGVATEVQWFKDAGKTVLELPSQFLRRVLTVEQTREYLREIGNR